MNKIIIFLISLSLCICISCSKSSSSVSSGDESFEKEFGDSPGAASGKSRKEYFINHFERAKISRAKAQQYLDKIKSGKTDNDKYDRMVLKRLIGDYDGSLSDAQAFIDKNPNDVSAKLNLAMNYFLMKKYKMAELVIRLSILEKNKDVPEAYNILGMISYKDGKDYDASQYFEKAISINSSHMGALLNLGILSLKNYDFETAKKYLEQVVDKNPKFASGFLYLAIAERGIKNTDQAIQYYDRAIDLDKNLFAVHFNKGILLYYDKKDLNEARKEFDYYTRGGKNPKNLQIAGEMVNKIDAELSRGKDKRN